MTPHIHSEKFQETERLYTEYVNGEMAEAVRLMTSHAPDHLVHLWNEETPEVCNRPFVPVLLHLDTLVRLTDDKLGAFMIVGQVMESVKEATLSMIHESLHDALEESRS